MIRKNPELLYGLARELRITRSAIYAWKVVPAERVLQVERYTGISRKLLRPDLFKDIP